MVRAKRVPLSTISAPLSRPATVTPVWVGCLSLLGFLSALAYSLAQSWHSYGVIWVGALALLGPVLVYEVKVSWVKMQPLPENAKEHFRRMNVKRIGFVATIALWAFVAWLFPYYEEPGGQLWNMLTYPATVWWKLFQWGSIEAWQYGVRCMALIIIDRYIAYTDLCLLEPRDGLFSMGSWVLGRKLDVDREALKQYGLQWTVKIFFLPWMLTWMHNNIVNLSEYPWSALRFAYQDKGISATTFFVRNWGLLQTILFTIDLAFAMVGYACTLKLLGTHIRSAQSTLFGWVICLFCYAPFQSITGNAFLNHNGPGNFEAMWADQPSICAVWAGVVLVLLSMYTFATVQFGMRFSNLTDRGILTTGLYGWTKHPAYIAKNIMWWLVDVPFFVAGQGWSTVLSHCIRLGLTNMVYYYRAKTEEAHLSQDETYRQYAAWIAEQGALAHIRKLFRRMV